jgi:hypothetical protein
MNFFENKKSPKGGANGQEQDFILVQIADKRF